MHVGGNPLYQYTRSTDMTPPRRKRASQESVPVPTRFTHEELARMERTRTALGSPSRSAFVRQAVLDKLDEVETMGILQLREVDEEEAARLMDEYLGERPGIHYVSELVEELGLEPRIAFAAAQRLVDEGRARLRGE